MNIGKNIEKIRNLKGYSQDQMARKLDMTQGNYSKIEADPENASLATLRKIAESLEVELTDILSEEKITINIGTQKGSNSNGYIVNNYAAKIEELYEARIRTYEERVKSLEEDVRFLRSLVSPVGGN